MSEHAADLQNTDRLFRIFVERAHDHAIFALTPDRVVATWNRGAQRLLGYEASEIIGQSGDVIFTPEDCAAGAPVRELAAAVRDGSATDDRWHVRKDGSRFWASGAVTRVELDDGKVIGAIKVLRDKTAEKRAREELEAHKATLEQEVARRVEESQRLARELIRTEQRQRRDLAQVIHDHLQQLLVAAKMHAERLPAQAESPEAVRRVGRMVIDLIGESIEASRSLMVDLNPQVLEQEGLVVALHWLAGQVKERHGLAVRVDAPDDAGPIGKTVAVALFRAVRELLFNTVKHAAVDQAAVTLRVPEPGRIRVVVEDEGKGFDPVAAAANKDINYGLSSVRQRITLLGGKVEIASEPGRGTRVTLEAPASTD